MAQPTAAQVQEYLAGMQYPATKDDIIKFARTKNAPDNVINALDSLSDDEGFENPAQLAEALEDVTLDTADDEDDEEKTEETVA